LETGKICIQSQDQGKRPVLETSDYRKIPKAKPSPTTSKSQRPAPETHHPTPNATTHANIFPNDRLRDIAASKPPSTTVSSPTHKNVLLTQPIIPLPHLRHTRQPPLFNPRRAAPPHSPPVLLISDGVAQNLYAPGPTTTTNPKNGVDKTATTNRLACSISYAFRRRNLTRRSVKPEPGGGLGPT
jgi:hypothetical protein